MSKNWLIDLIICGIITACAWGFALLSYGQDVQRNGTEFERKRDSKSRQQGHRRL